MKVITVLATLLITLSSCNCQKKAAEKKANEAKEIANNDRIQSPIPTIYYEAMSRGYFLAIKVENQTLFVSKERDFKEYSNSRTLLDEDWNVIVNLVKKVDLDKVKDYKWPTEKRYYDGAAHANVIFEKNGVKYPANGFDHGFPPVEVEALINKIVQLQEKK